MQAVPSLVGTGTAIAAAASGLVFAQSADESSLAISTLHDPPLSRQSSALRPLASPNAWSDSLASRPTSSTAATLPRSAAAPLITPPKGPGRRHSLVHRADGLPPPISETSRDSVSSNGSWIRRLSIRPLSQHGSPRSSVGPESPSLTFSFGSAAPILGSTPPQQQSRNKLVKRTTTGQDGNTGSISRRGSRSQMPILRRPATSHQRSATLQQPPIAAEASVFVPPASAGHTKHSLDQGYRPLAAPASAPIPISQLPATELVGRRDTQILLSRHRFPTRLKSFFHERLVKSAPVSRGNSPSGEGSPGSSGHLPRFSLPERRILMSRRKPATVYLTDAATILPVPSIAVSGPTSPLPEATATATAAAHAGTVALAGEAAGYDGQDNSSDDSPSRLPRRSLSMHFGSPSSWLPRSGSIRRPKRTPDRSADRSVNSSLTVSSRSNSSSMGKTNSHDDRLPQPVLPMVDGKRHVSAPVSSSRLQAQLQVQLQPRSVTTPANMRLRRAQHVLPLQQQDHSQQHQPHSLYTDGRSSPILPRSSDSLRCAMSGRQRNVSSPLPPPSPMSAGFTGFSNEFSRFGSTAAHSPEPGPAVFTAQKENYFPGSGTPYAYTTLPRSFPLVPRSRDPSYERSSTITGSDFEFRGFTSSGDDDDTDFKSDTVFDSLRTISSARVRTSDTPIESMFDESPPSTAGNGKTKRLSIQEILGQAWDSDTKILEEDEGAATPMRKKLEAQETCVSPTLSGSRPNGVSSRQEDYFETDPVRVPSVNAFRVDPGLSFAHRISFSRGSLYGDADDADDDENDDWARIDDDGVTNNLSPPASQTNSLRGANGLYGVNGGDHGSNSRAALAVTSGNNSPGRDTFVGENERPRSTLFDWSESVHADKADVDGHSPRPKTVHGKQELELRGGRPSNRKGPVAAHIRSQSVPAVADPADATKPPTSKFGTWATGPKNASEDWDDDFEFETCSNSDANGADQGTIGFADLGGGQSGLGKNTASKQSGKTSSASFSMVVPASIQATQPTVKAHSGQIRELSLLVNGLKRLCRHARDLEIVGEAPALWKEAENIIALASPDEDMEGTTSNAAVTTTAAPVVEDDAHADATSVDWSPRTSVDESIASDIDDRFMDRGFDAATVNGFDDAVSEEPRLSHPPTTPPPHEMGLTTVVRERQNLRRRSVFSPEDDIFGGSGWPLPDNKSVGVDAPQPQPEPPRTPDRVSVMGDTPDSAMIESIMEAMQQQRSASAPIRKSPVKQSPTELFFNTNTLQELVKRANTLFHTLSDVVRRAELLTQSPACTPKHERHYRREDGSPAFTRVFTDPSSPASPAKRLPQTHSSSSVLSRASPSAESPASTGISQRLQMMTVS